MWAGMEANSHGSSVFSRSSPTRCRSRRRRHEPGAGGGAISGEPLIGDPLGEASGRDGQSGCALMCACDLRISEAATLEVGAIDSAHILLRIIGKGDKEWRVSLPQLHDLRGRWQTHRNPHWLFPNRCGTNAAIQQLLCRTFKTAARARGGGSRGGSRHRRCAALFVMGLLYMLPFLIAKGRSLANCWSILLINLIFGWTLVLCLSWSVAGRRRCEHDVAIAFD